MSSKPIVTWNYLAWNPKSAYKQLFVKESRIRARTIYGLFVNDEEPMSPEEIAADFGISVEAVQEAIAYCQTDPSEIREDFEREERIMEATGMNDPDYRLGGKCWLLEPEAIVRILNS